MDGEIFTIRARRCKRCGRLLTSAEAVKKGMVASALQKHRLRKMKRNRYPDK